MIPAIFIKYFADRLGSTAQGMTDSKIAEYCSDMQLNLTLQFHIPNHQKHHI